jgi:hypothetical protein
MENIKPGSQDRIDLLDNKQSNKIVLIKLNRKEIAKMWAMKLKRAIWPINQNQYNQNEIDLLVALHTKELNDLYQIIGLKVTIKTDTREHGAELIKKLEDMHTYMFDQCLKLMTEEQKVEIDQKVLDWNKKQ